MISTAATKTPWLARARPNEHAALRLFCFPYAGGGALAFRGWADHMPSSVEVCPVQPPGRETRMRETPFNQVLPLARAAAEAIGPYLDKPFAFFGHSMGALIAFEVARELRRKSGRLPVKLYVSGRVAPQLPLARTPHLHSLPEPEFKEALRGLGGTPDGVLEDEMLMGLLVPLLRADFAVNEAYTYVAEPPLACPIFAMSGLRDAEVDREGLDGWREQTDGGFGLRLFPGDHFYLNSAQQLLLQVLAQDLAELARGRA
jgi:medium-chain acyl-[acyl-carrier-protein] hydrolase